MAASPTCGSRSLVASLAAVLVLPFALEAQERGGPVPLGRPLNSATANVAGPDPATITATGILAGSPLGGVDFAGEQLRFPRVRAAYQARFEQVRQMLHDHGIVEPAEMFFRVFKREQLLEVWARGAGMDALSLVTTYAVCGTSGDLGPKREQGDEQIPEGFYAIDVFNPISRFHLSLGVSYPNAVDRVRGIDGNLGGDIFIHGGCATVGCVPITDRGIEEVYVMALKARLAGQHQIPIHIFPTRLDDDGFAWLRDTFGTDHPEFQFWVNLREGYLAFEKDRTVPQVHQQGGRYTFPRGGGPLGQPVDG